MNMKRTRLLLMTMLLIGCEDSIQNLPTHFDSTVSAYSTNSGMHDATSKYIVQQLLTYTTMPHTRYAICVDISASVGVKLERVTPLLLLPLIERNGHTRTIIDLAVVFVNANSDVPALRFSDTPEILIPKAPSVDMDDPLSELSNAENRINPNQVAAYNRALIARRDSRWAEFSARFTNVSQYVAHSSDVGNAISHIQLLVNEKSTAPVSSYCLLACDFIPFPHKKLTGIFNLGSASEVVVVGADSIRAASILNRNVIMTESVSSGVQYLANLKNLK